MKKVNNKPFYPENAYCAIFGEVEYPNLPIDAEETLEYIMGTLKQREADIFMLRYKDEMTYAEIGESHNLHSREGVWQIINKAERKLRHPSRSRILSIGYEAYLNSTFVENEKKKKAYGEVIAKLETLIKEQNRDITEYRTKLANLNAQVEPATNVLDMKIDIWDLSVRSWNCLIRANIYTIKDLMGLSEEDYLRMRNLGQKSKKEVQDKLKIFTTSNEMTYPL